MEKTKTTFERIPIYLDKLSYDRYMYNIDLYLINPVNAWLKNSYNTLGMPEITRERILDYCYKGFFESFKRDYVAHFNKSLTGAKNTMLKSALQENLTGTLAKLETEFNKMRYRLEMAIGGVPFSIVQGQVIQTEADKEKCKEIFRIYIENEKEKELYDQVQELCNKLNEFPSADDPLKISDADGLFFGIIVSDQKGRLMIYDRMIAEIIKERRQNPQK